MGEELTGGGYYLTEQQGKAVQEILNRYLDVLRTNIEVYEEDNETPKDVEYIERLSQLFGDN